MELLAFRSTHIYLQILQTRFFNAMITISQLYKHVLCESEWGLFIYSIEVAIAL